MRRPRRGACILQLSRTGLRPRLGDLAGIDAELGRIEGEFGALLDSRDDPSSQRVGLALVVFFGGMFAALAVFIAGGPGSLAIPMFIAALISLFTIPGTSKGTARRLYCTGRVVQGEIRSASPADGHLQVSYAFGDDRQTRRMPLRSARTRVSP